MSQLPKDFSILLVPHVLVNSVKIKGEEQQQKQFDAPFYDY